MTQLTKWKLAIEIHGYHEFIMCPWFSFMHEALPPGERITCNLEN